MKRTVLASAITLLAVTATNAGAGEIRHYPGASAIVLPLRGEGAPSDLNTLVLHNLLIANDTDSPTRLGAVTLALTRNGKPVQTVSLEEDELDSAARKWRKRQDAGIVDAYDALFQTSRFMSDVAFAASTELQPGEGILLTRKSLMFQGMADALTVTAFSADGESVVASKSIPVRPYKSQNSYIFPLEGRWFIAAGPSLQSHHRWAPVQEFALDILALGRGTNTHNLDGARARMYYAFGAPVMAAASGKVVAATDRYGDEESLRRRGESEEDFSARQAAMQGELLQEGIVGILGNHVIIEHANEEYSYYAHLKKGSVKVAVGDEVR